jgi:hypothetical protein
MSRIEDVYEAVKVVETIVNGTKEMKYGGFKTANEIDGAEAQQIEETEINLSDEFIAKLIFDSWQSIEVTNRTLAKSASKVGVSSEAFGENTILKYIQDKGFGYIDGMAKIFKVSEDQVYSAVTDLVAQKKIYKHEKGYYKISKWVK